MRTANILRQITNLTSQDADTRLAAVKYLSTLTNVQDKLAAIPFLGNALLDEQQTVVSVAAITLAVTGDQLGEDDRYATGIAEIIPQIKKARKQWASHRQISRSLDALVAPVSGWSQELRDMTYRIIDRLELQSFMVEGRCHLKHFGDENRFGYILLQDAMDYRFVIHITESDQTETFKTLDKLIAAGWVVD